MNSARTLADRFRTQRTEKIRVDGVEVLSMTELTIESDEVVEVMVESSRDDIEQSFHIRARRADLEVLDHAALGDEDYEFDGSIYSDNLTIVANQSRRIEFAIALDEAGDDEEDEATQPPVRLQLWNSWLLGAAEHAWTGNSGIVVEELEPPAGAKSRMRLWCSDGLGDPQFDDLVVLLTVGEFPEDGYYQPLAEVSADESE